MLATPQALSLVPTLRCPKCDKKVFRMDPELFIGTLACEKKQCDCRWWATALSAGSVPAQLVEQFEDEAFVAELVAAWHLPPALPEPMFWQIPLTGHQHYAYQRDGSRHLLRTLVLVLRPT